MIYEIIEETSKQDLEKKVNHYLKIGYLLQGGVHYFYTKEENGNGYVQYLEMYTQAIYHPTLTLENPND